MIPKFNKQTGRWGVWVTDLGDWRGFWLVRQSSGKELRFQSKQEAAAYLRVSLSETD